MKTTLTPSSKKAGIYSKEIMVIIPSVLEGKENIYCNYTVYVS